MTRRNSEKNADMLRETLKPSEGVFSGTSHIGSVGRLASRGFFGALSEADLSLAKTNGLKHKIGDLEGRNDKLSYENERLRADRQEYREDSRTDALTGLLNRTGFEEAFEAWRISNPDSKIALIFIDLNDLKVFNDTFSHAIGDEAIRLLGKTIESVTRGNGRGGDIIARPHGDEFILGLVESVDGEPSRGNQLDLESYMNDLPCRIRQALESALVPKDVPDGLIKSLMTKLRTIKFAYGGTICNKDDLMLPIKTLLGRAEELMYADKHEQKRLIQIAQSENSIEYRI